MFLTNTQLLSSQDVNWWTGVVWIIVMLLSVGMGIVKVLTVLLLLSILLIDPVL